MEPTTTKSREFYLLRDKNTQKFFRKLPTLGGITAVCDASIDSWAALQHLFIFDTPESAFQFLNTTGKPLPRDVEVVPFFIECKNTVQCIDVIATEWTEEQLSIVPTTPAPPPLKCKLCGRAATLLEKGDVCNQGVDGKCPGVIE